MITAVDTAVLIDVFAADQTFGHTSSQALRQALKQGRLIACEVVLAEVCAAFSGPESAKNALASLGIEFSAIDYSSALLAGALFARYRSQGGQRIRIAPDFLIGAHAQFNADRFLTRDHGFYRQYFSDIEIWNPSVQK